MLSRLQRTAKLDGAVRSIPRPSTVIRAIKHTNHALLHKSCVPVNQLSGAVQIKGKVSARDHVACRAESAAAAESSGGTGLGSMGKNADKTAEPWVDTHARRQRAWIRRNPRPHSYVQRLVWHEHHVQHVRRAPGLPLGMLHVACRPALDASCLPCAQTRVPHPCMLRRQCQNCSFNKELFSVFKYPLTTTLVQVSRRAMTGNLG